MNDPLHKPPDLLGTLSDDISTSDFDKNSQSKTSSNRNDVSIRKKERKIFKFTAVVMKLNSILINQQSNIYKTHLLDIISTINRMGFLTYSFINLHILRIISEKGPMPPFNDQNWYNIVCNSIIPSRDKIRIQKPSEEQKEIQKTLDVFKTLFPDDYQFPDRTALTELQSTLMAHIKTSLTEHIEQNMSKRIEAYLKVKYDITNPGLRKYITDKIINGSSDFESKFDSDPDALRIIPIYRGVFTQEAAEIKDKKELKKKEQSAKRFKLKLEKQKYQEELKQIPELLEKEIMVDLFDKNSIFFRDNSNDINLQKGKYKINRKTKDEKAKDSSLTNNKISRFLMFEYHMLSEVERLEGKKWTVTPLKGSFVDNHITITTSCMINILKSYHLKDKTKPLTYFKDMKDNIWNEIFMIPPNRGRYSFANMITTNGCSVSVYYKIIPDDFEKLSGYKNYNYLSLEEKYDALTRYKKTKEALLAKQTEKEQIEGKTNGEIMIQEIQKHIGEEFDRVLGLDPGSRSMFTSIDNTGLQSSSKNKRGQILRCTGKEYKHLTGQKERTKLVNKRKDKIPVMKEMLKISFKTSSYEKYQQNLKNFFLIEKEVLEEYKRIWYRQIKFSGYRKKQKTFDILAKRLEEKEIINEDNKKKKIKEKVLIGWGNGGNGSGKLKGTKVPGKAFRNYIEKNTSIVVVDVDENRTTKMCSNCGFETGKMKEYRTIKRVTEEKGEETMYKNVQVYGIRRCKNNDCRITWDRDVNASENILKILLCHLERKDRPTYLCRKSKDLVSDARKGAVSETTNPKKTVGELHELSKTKIKILIKKKIDLSQSL